MYSLSSATKDAQIRYTLNGNNPTENSNVYKKPIDINETTTIKAASFKGENQISNIHQNRINLHKAVGKNITLSVEPNESYNTGGKQALINGISGSNKRYGDKEWLGFFGDDVTISIDLDSITTINSIKTRFYNGNGQWIYAPKKLSIIFDNTEK